MGSSATTPWMRRSGVRSGGGGGVAGDGGAAGDGSGMQVVGVGRMRAELLDRQQRRAPFGLASAILGHREGVPPLSRALRAGLGELDGVLDHGPAAGSGHFADESVSSGRHRWCPSTGTSSRVVLGVVAAWAWRIRFAGCVWTVRICVQNAGLMKSRRVPRVRACRCSGSGRLGRSWRRRLREVGGTLARCLATWLLAVAWDAPSRSAAWAGGAGRGMGRGVDWRGWFCRCQARAGAGYGSGAVCRWTTCAAGRAFGQ
ncbi:hypothetical protein H4W33_010185 [Kibdelosporangium phytohabitans]|nr:hypothetical protein [Kibdelosporangium phytohabitans]